MIDIEHCSFDVIDIEHWSFDVIDIKHLSFDVIDIEHWSFVVFSLNQPWEHLQPVQTDKTSQKCRLV